MWVIKRGSTFESGTPLGDLITTQIGRLWNRTHKEEEDLVDPG